MKGHFRVKIAVQSSCDKICFVHAKHVVVAALFALKTVVGNVSRTSKATNVKRRHLGNDKYESRSQSLTCFEREGGYL